MVNAHMAEEAVIDKIADAVPSMFVDVMLPLMLSIMEVTVDQRNQPPWSDRVWGNSIYNSKTTLASRLLSGLESSLAWVAANEPDHFRSVSLTLRESPFRTTQTILFSSYATGGEAFADEAIEYLLAEMHAKLASTSQADSAHKAILAATPHCSSDNFANLERAILNHVPEWEREPAARTLRGISQFRLLANMDAGRLSKKAILRLQELHRKFGDDAPPLRIEIQSGMVRSPISESSAANMNDEQWLRLSGATLPLHQMPLQTSSLGERTNCHESLKRKPRETLAGLPISSTSFLMTPTAPILESILRGIIGADIEMATVAEACLHCYKIGRPQIGRWVTPPLVHFTKDHLPQEVLDMVAWYATNDPDPDAGTSSDRTYYQNGEEFQHYDPWIVGVNSVRGTAAESIAKLIAQEEDYLGFFEPYLRLMVRDPSDAVRVCVVETLLGVLRHNPDLAVELFLTLWDSDERLLGTPPVERFLKYAVPTHFGQLEPILLKMMESEHEVVVMAGARWSCYASLTVEDAAPLAGALRSWV